jgi:hypothetical protein
MPYTFWQCLFVGHIIKGGHANEFTVDAAGEDFRTLKTFISHGVSVSVHTKREWTTPLHTAAAFGNIEIIDY